MGVVTVDTAFFDRLMHYAVIEFLLLGLMADQTEILPGSFHGHRIKGAVRAVTGDTDPGAHRTVNMGGFAHIGMAFSCSAIGPGRDNLFEIVLPAAQLMTLFTVKGNGVVVEIKTLVPLGAGFILLRRAVIHLHLLLQFVGAQGDDIFPFPERNHRPECPSLNRKDSTGTFVVHPIDGNPLDLGSVNKAGKEKLFPGYPSAIRRSNDDYLRLRGPGSGGRKKNTEPKQKK